MLRGTAGAPFAGGWSKPDTSPANRAHAHSAHRSRKGTFLAIVALLIFGALASGCDVLVTDRTPPPPSYPAGQRPSNVSDAPNTQETHDLAIAAVDFDPAIDLQQIASGRPYSLLVAVENKGNRREGPITVTAQLLTLDRQQVLMSGKQSVSLLAPGDITLVRFRRDTPPPRHRAYILNTQVLPVPREPNTTNNQRVLEIQLNTGN
jgi:hypothetical protein